MNNSPNTSKIDSAKYGVSFSLKQCRAFGIGQTETLGWLIDQGWRRFRLMSYWDEHEKVQGVFDFSALDRQIDQIQKAGGVVTLCLGARQPRWPENHWPDWAWDAPKAKRTEALLAYIETVVERYKNNPAIISWQLENEALLEDFGKRPEVDRKRLSDEFALVKKLDPSRPVIMTTSTSWGIPLRRPIPDIVGFSFYQVVYASRRYKVTPRPTWIDRTRALLIQVVWHRQSFIHELQCEPWGSKAIWEMTPEEQDKSMGVEQIKNNIQTCQKSGLYPMDLWGGEWWYWRSQQGDNSIWEAVLQSING